MVQCRDTSSVTRRARLSLRHSVRFSSRHDFEKRLDVVKDRVTSPLEREDVSSNLTWSTRSAGQ
jgi:hypothetical protein